MDTLIAEDLLLLLLEDEKGTTPSLWVDAKVPLAAAVLGELAIRGAVDLEPAAGLHGARLRATGLPEQDPVLARGLAVVAEKPRSPSSLVQRVGTGLRDELAERLVARGVLERREERILGLFPRTVWPAVDLSREQAARERLRQVLVAGAEPGEREAVLAGILGALDRIPRTLELHGAEAREAKRRAKAIAKGEWSSKVVSEAVQATMVAVMTPVLITTTTTGGT